jgi:hypothetical protein
MRVIIVLWILLLVNSTDIMAYDCSSLSTAWSTRRNLYNEYWEKVGKCFDPTKVKDIKPLIEKNDGLYRNYIKYMFFDDDGSDRCSIDDPIVELVNIYSDVERGIATYDQLGKIMLDQVYGAEAVWIMDTIVGKDSTLLRQWLSKYTLSPAFNLIEGLSSSITFDTKDALKYFIFLFKSSDGMYAEYFNEKIYEVFKNKPQLVLSVFSYFLPVRQRIRVCFCEIVSEEERQALITTYQQYTSNANASQVLDWLLCKKRN